MGDIIKFPDRPKSDESHNDDEHERKFKGFVILRVYQCKCVSVDCDGLTLEEAKQAIDDACYWNA